MAFGWGILASNNLKGMPGMTRTAAIYKDLFWKDTLLSLEGLQEEGAATSPQDIASCF